MPIGTIADPTIFEGYSAGDPVQSNRLRAKVAVLVGASSYTNTGFGSGIVDPTGPTKFLDITSKLSPHLISVRCLVGARTEDYQVELELDDRDGSLPIPPIDTPLQCYFGWEGESTMLKVWDGGVHDVEYGFNRKDGGRKMWIHGFGGSFLDKGKEPVNFVTGEGSKDEGVEMGKLISIATHLQKTAEFSGQTIAVHPKVAAFKQDHFEQKEESYYHWGKTWVEKAGGLFRVTGITKGEAMWQGEDGNGNPFPTIDAVWGKNLISFRVRPFAARPMWTASRSHFFDIPLSQWKMTQTATSGMQSAMSSAISALPNPAPNQNASQQDTSGQSDGTLQYQGPGKIVINGEPRATGNGYVNIIGVRPGVDGRYWIETAEHIYSRTGYLTWLDVIADTTSSGSEKNTLAGNYSLFNPNPTPVGTTVVPVQTIP